MEKPCIRRAGPQVRPPSLSYEHWRSSRRRRSPHPLRRFQETATPPPPNGSPAPSPGEVEHKRPKTLGRPRKHPLPAPRVPKATPPPKVTIEDQRAIWFLEEALATGPVPVQDVEEQGERRSINRLNPDKARHLIGIKVARFPGSNAVCCALPSPRNDAVAMMQTNMNLSANPSRSPRS